MNWKATTDKEKGNSAILMKVNHHRIRASNLKGSKNML
jgi:hypothetical protein